MQQYVYANEGRVLLREATGEDIDKIYDMYQETYPQSWWQNKELNRFRYNLIKEIGGRIFVAVLDDKIIGHTELVLPQFQEEPVYLVRLEIHDDYRRRKFGIELVRYSAIIMKNLGYQAYVTWPDTNKSKGLYKKVGLKEIESNPQLLVKIVDKRKVVVDEVKELSFDQQPDDLEVVVGCPWSRDYTWNKAFRAGKEEVLDYQGPYLYQVNIKGIRSVILLDGHSFYLYLPEEEKDNVEVIEKLIVYTSNMAYDNDIYNLRINLNNEVWSNLDFSDIWEIEKEEERLEMRMNF